MNDLDKEAEAIYAGNLLKFHNINPPLIPYEKISEVSKNAYRELAEKKRIKDGNS